MASGALASTVSTVPDTGVAPPRCPPVPFVEPPTTTDVRRRGDERAAAARQLRRRLGWFLSMAGRTLVTGGILTLLFAAFELWGTDYLEARSQRALRVEFAERLAAPPDPTRPENAGSPAPTPPAVRPGEPVAAIVIPAIGLDRTVVEGVEDRHLEMGPGHYPETPLPGRAGNAAIAGHRTTWGAPFLELDRLQPGDEIVAQTAEGRFVYRVTGQSIVAPGQVSVLAPTDSPQLTLTTCNPRYSARERLVVRAELVGEPFAEPAGAEPPEATTSAGGGPVAGLAETGAVSASSRELTSSGGLGHVDHGTLGWGFAVVALGALWWLAFRRRPRWTTWLGGAGPFLVVLAPFFVEVSRLLPSNF